jgi:hypothetical protein
MSKGCPLAASYHEGKDPHLDYPGARQNAPPGQDAPRARLLADPAAQWQPRDLDTRGTTQKKGA